jgi:hypothetical protein
MAKQLGALVGTPKAASPPQLVDFGLERCSERILVRDTVELAANAADTVQAAVLPWETLLDPASTVWFDDLGVGGTLSLGDVSFPNALMNAVNTDSAAGNSPAMAAVDIANYWKPLWAVLGYANLAAAQVVGAQCELLFKRNTAAGAGTISWRFKGIAK